MLDLNDDSESVIGTCKDEQQRVLSPFTGGTSLPYTFLPPVTNHNGRDDQPPSRSLDLNPMDSCLGIARETRALNDSLMDAFPLAHNNLAIACEARASDESNFLCETPYYFIETDQSNKMDACIKDSRTSAESDYLCGTSYHFIGTDHLNKGGVCVKDSQFSSEIEPVLSLKRAWDHSPLLMNDVNLTEILPAQLSLGSRTLSPLGRSLSLEEYNKDSSGLSLSMPGLANEAANVPGQLQDLQPFWRGRVCAKGKTSTPVFAYCLGHMKTDSRLKQLPAVLRLHEHATFDELNRVLRHGVIEPLTQFKPSSDASVDEIQQFKAVVEKLSRASNPLDVELSQQGNASNAVFAAFIALSLDGASNSFVNLYLIPCSNFKRLVGNSEFKESLCGVKEFDSESLLGIICKGSANLLSDYGISQTTELTNNMRNVKDMGKDDAAVEMSTKYTSITKKNLDCGVSFEDRGRDLNDHLENCSSTRKMHHTTKDDLIVDCNERQFSQRESGRHVHSGEGNVKSRDTLIWMHDRRDRCVYQDKTWQRGVEMSTNDLYEDVNARFVNKRSVASSRYVSDAFNRYRYAGDQRSKRRREDDKEDSSDFKHTREREVDLGRMPNEYITKCQLNSKDIKEGFWETITSERDLRDVKRNALYADQQGSVSHETAGSVHTLIDKLNKKHAILQPAVVMEHPPKDPADKTGLVEVDNDSCLLAKVPAEEVSTEFLLEDLDKETKTWLTSKLCAAFLLEEYSVRCIMKPADVNAQPTRNGHLEVRISMLVSDNWDATETRWFVDQAATMVRAIASHGVFMKCIWYDGPIQIEEAINAPTIPDIVKKIKGDDGKNLERIQEVTGVMIGVVLRKGGPQEVRSWPRVIGLRLKCVRRSGLQEATKQVMTLLQEALCYFSVSAQLEDASIPNPLELEKPASVHLLEGESSKVNLKSSKENDVSGPAPIEEESFKPAHKAPSDSCECERDFRSKLRKMCYRPLYVGNLPRDITATRIQSIIEGPMKERFRLTTDLVAHVHHLPDKCCAFVEFVSDDLLTAALKLFEEDRAVYQGLHVKLGYAAMAERQTSFSKFGIKGRVSAHKGDLKRSPLRSDRNKSEDFDGREISRRGSDSDFPHHPWSAEGDNLRFESFLERPRPLFLSDLFDNASAQTIRQLFENVITRYIGPSLVSSNEKQLILDVRYIPSRGCAFVDLATSALVEFILNLYSRRPELFMNMKMELGKKPVPWLGEEESGGRRKGDEMVHHHELFEPRHRVLGSRKRGDKEDKEKPLFGGHNILDYIDEGDVYDEVLKQNSRIKKLRLDPEKTIFADCLPPNTTEATVWKMFEHVLMVKAGMDVCDRIITEVHLVASKYSAFIVFTCKELSRLVLSLYSQDQDVFGGMRLKPYFHLRLEDLYRDDVGNDGARKFNAEDVNVDGAIARARQSEMFSEAIRSSAHRSVDRRRSVYVDNISEDLSEPAMKEIFESALSSRKHGHDRGHAVSQVVYFRDKFDPLKLCAFVEACSEDAARELINFYNANQEVFRGMRVRPGFKYNC